MHILPVYALNFEILKFSAGPETHFKSILIFGGGKFNICGLDHFASELFICPLFRGCTVVTWQVLSWTLCLGVIRIHHYYWQEEMDKSGYKAIRKPDKYMHQHDCYTLSFGNLWNYAPLADWLGMIREPEDCDKLYALWHFRSLITFLSQLPLQFCSFIAWVSQRKLTSWSIVVNRSCSNVPAQ